ncbi:MAG: 50S ribosomal protein L13 [Chloroflexi bacterium]|nr:50S ribosomal protein L13 [Chloroflexota bacterium]
MKTYALKEGDIIHQWFVVDATDQNLGRLATRVASILMGKHKPTFTPHLDNGDNVVVINAEKIAVSPKRLLNKLYYSHSGYPMGLKKVSMGRLMNTHPDRIVREAIWGMVPHNRLGRAMIKKLKVYAGPEHPHIAQQPQPLEL